MATIVFRVGMLCAQRLRTIHGFVSDARCGATHSSPMAGAIIVVSGASPPASWKG